IWFTYPGLVVTPGRQQLLIALTIRVDVGQFSLNLRTLSTSAPAPSTRVNTNVSRRGTCDRGIWTKPLAFAADAEGYINIMVWGLNGRFAISSPSGHANCQFC